jgi:DNA polymerase-3 subunit epsilon
VTSQLDGRVFTAHNAPFDWSFVRNELTATGREELDVERLCTVRMGRYFLPDLHRHGLDALAAHYRIPVEGRHRARGDALATAHILLHLLELARAEGIADWASLRHALRARRGKGVRRRRQREAAARSALEGGASAQSQPSTESE